MKLKYIFVLILLGISFFAKSQTAKEFYSMGMVKMLEGKYEACIADFSNAIKKDKKLTDAYYNRGIAYEKIGEHQKAIKDYSVVVKQKPYMYQAFNNRGLLYVRINDYQKAIADFTTSIRINSSYPFSYLYRANAYMLNNQLDKAKSDANIVLQRLPNYLKAHSIIAQISYIQKDYSNALVHYNFLCEKQSSKAENFLGRARVYKALSKANEACNDYKRAIELGSKEAENEKPVSCN